MRHNPRTGLPVNDPPNGNPPATDPPQRFQTMTPLGGRYENRLDVVDRDGPTTDHVLCSPKADTARLIAAALNYYHQAGKL